VTRTIGLIGALAVAVTLGPPAVPPQSAARLQLPADLAGYKRWSRSRTRCPALNSPYRGECLYCVHASRAFQPRKVASAPFGAATRARSEAHVTSS
jgi:hypothetical protein